jgi:uncharacterized protein YndB with AHSA1/START domain
MKNAAMLKVTTPTDFEIVMTRAFNAPRRLVWDAMTKPEYIRRWLYAPEGWSMTVCEGDVRVGGSFRWEWNGPDGKPALSLYGVYREVVPPERIVHTESMEMGGSMDTRCNAQPAIATLMLAEQGGRTMLRMTMMFPSKELRDGALASGMEHGVAAGYDRLDELLVTLAKAPAN